MLNPVIKTAIPPALYHPGNTWGNGRDKLIGRNRLDYRALCVGGSDRISSLPEAAYRDLRRT